MQTDTHNMPSSLDESTPHIRTVPTICRIPQMGQSLTPIRAIHTCMFFRWSLATAASIRDAPSLFFGYALVEVYRHQFDPVGSHNLPPNVLDDACIRYWMMLVPDHSLTSRAVKK